jgi:hypothetical protein
MMAAISWSNLSPRAVLVAMPVLNIARRKPGIEPYACRSKLDFAASIDDARPAHRDWTGNGTVIDQFHPSWPGRSSSSLIPPDCSTLAHNGIVVFADVVQRVRPTAFAG